jgi:hypothetical protein
MIQFMLDQVAASPDLTVLCIFYSAAAAAGRRSGRETAARQQPADAQRSRESSPPLPLKLLAAPRRPASRPLPLPTKRRPPCRHLFPGGRAISSTF